MEAILRPLKQASRFVPRIVGESGPLLRYRISFADGSVGTRYYVEPLRIGQRIFDRGSGAHVICSVDREPAGSVGRASAVLAAS
jgi:hypothetical protein